MCWVRTATSAGGIRDIGSECRRHHLESVLTNRFVLVARDGGIPLCEITPTRDDDVSATAWDLGY